MLNPENKPSLPCWHLSQVRRLCLAFAAWTDTLVPGWEVRGNGWCCTVVHNGKHREDGIKKLVELFFKLFFWLFDFPGKNDVFWSKKVISYEWWWFDADFDGLNEVIQGEQFGRLGTVLQGAPATWGILGSWCNKSWMNLKPQQGATGHQTWPANPLEMGWFKRKIDINSK